MRIKSIVILLLAIFYLLLVIPGCEDDVNEPEASMTDQFIGAWNLVKAVKLSDNTEAMIPSGFQTLTFSENGTFRVEMENLYNTGTWEVEGANLNLVFTTVQIEGPSENFEYAFPYDFTDQYLIITSGWDFEDAPGVAADLYYSEI